MTLYHDESSFQSNDDQGMMWAQPDQTAIKPKVIFFQKKYLSNRHSRAEDQDLWLQISLKNMMGILE